MSYELKKHDRIVSPSSVVYEVSSVNAAKRLVYGREVRPNGKVLTHVTALAPEAIDWPLAPAMAALNLGYYSEGYRQGVEDLERRRVELMNAVLAADRAGISRATIVRVAGVAAKTVYGWLSDAGRPMSAHHGGRR